VINPIPHGIPTSCDGTLASVFVHSYSSSSVEVWLEARSPLCAIQCEFSFHGFKLMSSRTVLVLTLRIFSGFFSTMAVHAAHQSQFFISYVLVAGGIQVFMSLSQGHNAILHYTMKRMTKEEATSERRLEHMKKDIRAFHLDENVPLFLFVFMVGVLYGWIAPISNLFVYGFFKSAHKVFKYMVGVVALILGRILRVYTRSY
jgi:hypothetical protein